MVNFPGRNGRRRRVLNDEVLSASNSRTAFRTVTDEESGHAAPRYSDAAGVENHPQITDFVPRRYRSIALLVMTGVVSTVGFAAVHQIAPLLQETIGVADLASLDLASAGSIAAWVAAVVLLLATALCLLIYSLRRHRIDDYRGRYRIWLAAAAACLVLSANSVAGLHHLLAEVLTQVTGWSLLRAGAIWWLAACGLPIAWVVVRTLLDVAECRLAAALWVAAIGCYAAAAACYLGLIPSFGAHLDAGLHVSLTLVAHWFMLAAVVSYARFVVLDAQGLIPARPRSRRTGSVKGESEESLRRSTQSALRKIASQTAPITPAVADKDWVDGRRPERDPYDDGDDPTPSTQNLSKADRKRLRKFKAQNRAA
jgi:hypothetical protein